MGDRDVLQRSKRLNRINHEKKRNRKIPGWGNYFPTTGCGGTRKIKVKGEELRKIEKGKLNQRRQKKLVVPSQ